MLKRRRRRSKGREGGCCGDRDARFHALSSIIDETCRSCCQSDPEHEASDARNILRNAFLFSHSVQRMQKEGGRTAASAGDLVISDRFSAAADDGRRTKQFERRKSETA